MCKYPSHLARSRVVFHLQVLWGTRESLNLSSPIGVDPRVGVRDDMRRTTRRAYKLVEDTYVVRVRLGY